MDTPRWIRAVLVAGLAVLTACALVISYQGLYVTAVHAAVPTPELWPVLVDVFGLTIAVLVWHARRVDRHPWVAHGALVAVTGWSVFCQMSTVDKPDPTAMDRVVHAWAPLLVLGMFEALLWAVGMFTTTTPAAVDVPAQADTPATATLAVVPDVPGLPDKWRDAVLALHAADTEITGSSLGRAAGVDPSYGRRMLKTHATAIADLIAELDQTKTALMPLDTPGRLGPGRQSERAESLPRSGSSTDLRFSGSV